MAKKGIPLAAGAVALGLAGAAASQTNADSPRVFVGPGENTASRIFERAPSPGPGRPRQHIFLLDVDDDHDAASRDELADAVAARVTEVLGACLAAVDIDGDETVSADDVPQAMECRSEECRSGLTAGRLLARFDINRNGVVTREEFDEVARQMFVRFDYDGDGAIELDGLPAARGRR